MKGNFNWEDVLNNIDAYIAKMNGTDCIEEKEFFKELIRKAQDEQVKSFKRAA